MLKVHLLPHALDDEVPSMRRTLAQYHDCLARQQVQYNPGMPANIYKTYHNARSFKGSIRYLLRSATATNHAQVDERIAELIGQGEAGYREFLRLSAVAIRPLEESLSAANVECILPDWRERSRWASLRADLADLGMTPAPAAPVPRLDGEAHQFGVLYVLEGSRLGANVLLRRLLAMPSLPPLRALRYLRHGEGHPLWHTFLQRLESSAAVRRSPMEAIAGAKAAFRFFLPM
jgi:heme oxygenase (biliverdin-IX-beta and delta-forming)